MKASFLQPPPFQYAEFFIRERKLSLTQNLAQLSKINQKLLHNIRRIDKFKNTTVESHYNNDPGSMKITLLYNQGFVISGGGGGGKKCKELGPAKITLFKEGFVVFQLLLITCNFFLLCL